MKPKKMRLVAEVLAARDAVVGPTEVTVQTIPLVSGRAVFLPSRSVERIA